MSGVKIFVAIATAFACLAFLPSGGKSFEVVTHSALSLRATRSSALDAFLKSELAVEFSNGIATTINTRRIEQHVAQGSEDEDRPFLRVQEHFHNPLLPWNEAGSFGLSSVIWSQTVNQAEGFFGGDHSWHDARASYLAALTSVTKIDRESAYVSVFETLGHVIHLVQDAASPAHTREDIHANFLGIGDQDRFHTWGQERQIIQQILLGTKSLPFEKSILDLSQNPFAPIPIARIMDTDKYDGTNPEVTNGGKIGIAEYSNANFFSDDTIWSDDDSSPRFPFPNKNSGSVCESPINLRQRAYFCKTSEQGNGYKLAAISSLSKYLEVGFERPVVGLDDAVMEDYGNELLPRAIGYSAGLIDYFFRGRLDVSVAESDSPEGKDASSLRINVSNATSAGDWPGNSETEEGSLVAVLMSGDKVLGVTGPSEAGNNGKYEVTRAPQEFTFNFGSGQGAGENSDVSVMLVYRGPLGREEDAVAVGRAPLSPLSVDPLNGTLSCPDGTVTFTASGGLPPYTWLATQGTLLVDEDGRTAHLKTENSGNVSGNAYRVIGDALRTVFPFQCRARQSRCTITYTCDDSVALRQESGGAGETHYICQSPDSGTGCGLENCGESLCEFVEGNPSSAYFEDLRTPEMIDSGCAPCTLVAKEGVIVTIKDSSGAEVTAAVAGGTASSATASGP